jgi:hypothetical protein
MAHIFEKIAAAKILVKKAAIKKRLIAVLKKKAESKKAE